VFACRRLARPPLQPQQHSSLAAAPMRKPAHTPQPPRRTTGTRLPRQPPRLKLGRRQLRHRRAVSFPWAVVRATAQPNHPRPFYVAAAVYAALQLLQAMASCWFVRIGRRPRLWHPRHTGSRHAAAAAGAAASAAPRAAGSAVSAGGCAPSRGRGCRGVGAAVGSPGRRGCSGAHRCRLPHCTHLSRSDIWQGEDEAGGQRSGAVAAGFR
jgi:hypothetical protein